MIQTHFKAIRTKSFSDGINIGESEEAKICTECPLPAKKCRPLSCKRYKEEKAKLLKKGGKK